MISSAHEVEEIKKEGKIAVQRKRQFRKEVITGRTAVHGRQNDARSGTILGKQKRKVQKLHSRTVVLEDIVAQ